MTTNNNIAHPCNAEYLLAYAGSIKVVVMGVSHSEELEGIMLDVDPWKESLASAVM